MGNRWKTWARAIKRDVHALYLAGRDPRVPWVAKALAVAVAAYAFSPIDLIPDFVPVLGHLDDLLIVPIGIWIVVRMIPPAVMTDLRKRAEEAQARPASRAAAIVIVLIWTLSIALVGWLLTPYLL